MAIASLEGFGKGFVNAAYPSAAVGVPVLNSFYFGFGVGGPGVDNELQSIMLLPGGGSTDLTPNADLAPSTVPAGRADLLFRDDDPTDDEDEYFFRAAHVMFDGRFARRFQFRDVGDTGKISRPLPAGIFGGPIGVPTRSVLALAGFKLFFTGNREHEIDQISVMLEDDNTITIALNDKNDDDVFGYLIDIVRISGLGLNVVRGESSGSARGGDRVELRRPSGTDFVIRGFDFDYRSGDHELRDIGVIRHNDRLEVFFSDKNSDDPPPFTWKVRWAHIGAMVVAPI